MLSTKETTTTQTTSWLPMERLITLSMETVTKNGWEVSSLLVAIQYLFGTELTIRVIRGLRSLRRSQVRAHVRGVRALRR